jgi:fluoride exporter
MSGIGFLAVFTGAGLGACLRWLLSMWLNPLWPAMPLGTLAANLGGGLLVGIAGACLGPGLAAPEWRLFAATGFLGGLTTFSTFSAEVVHLVERQQPGWALATAALHLAGSLALTALGLFIGRACVLR